MTNLKKSIFLLSSSALFTVLVFHSVTLSSRAAKNFFSLGWLLMLLTNLMISTTIFEWPFPNVTPACFLRVGYPTLSSNFSIRVRISKKAEDQPRISDVVSTELRHLQGLAPHITAADRADGMAAGFLTQLGRIDYASSGRSPRRRGSREPFALGTIPPSGFEKVGSHLSTRSPLMRRA